MAKIEPLYQWGNCLLLFDVMWFCLVVCLLLAFCSVCVLPDCVCLWFMWSFSSVFIVLTKLCVLTLVLLLPVSQSLDYQGFPDLFKKTKTKQLSYKIYLGNGRMTSKPVCFRTVCNKQGIVLELGNDKDRTP